VGRFAPNINASYFSQAIDGQGPMNAFCADDQKIYIEVLEHLYDRGWNKTFDNHLLGEDVAQLGSSRKLLKRFLGVAALPARERDRESQQFGNEEQIQRH
jgi:hypothetical protein